MAEVTSEQTGDIVQFVSSDIRKIYDGMQVCDSMGNFFVSILFPVASSYQSRMQVSSYSFCSLHQLMCCCSVRFLNCSSSIPHIALSTVVGTNYCL